MEIHHFRYFLAVARHRHFTLAAEQLGIAPSALTRLIQDLERTLDTPLFLREQREVRLTDAGRCLQIEAALALRQFEAEQYTVRRPGQAQAGQLELGYMESVMFSGVPQRQVEQFRQRYADVHINATECAMATLPRLIEQGRLDLGFMRSPMSLPPSLCAIAFLTEGFALALPKNSPLCTLDLIKASDLRNETFILAQQLSGTLEVAAQGGFSPILGPQLNSLTSVIARVSLGQGVAVVPNAVVNYLNLPGVVFRRIQDSQATSSLSLIHRRNESDPIATCFIELMDTYREA